MAEPWRGPRAKVKPVWLLFVNAPRTRTRRGDVEEHEAEQDRRIAAVQKREEALARVHQEISERHFAGQNERGIAAEQTDRDEGAADHFEQARTRQHRVERAVEH